jgi:hypothetical protein
MAGRPAKKKTELRDKPLRIRLTQLERKTIDAAAAAMSLDTSAWARMILLKSARGNA